MTVPVAPLSSTDVAAIDTLHRRFSAALLRRDFGTLSAMYTEDAVFMPPHEPAVEGRSAVRTWMSAFPPLSEFALTTDRIDGRADLAYVRGGYAMTFRPEGAPAAISDAGKFLEVFRRQPDGEWLIEADIFNSNRP